MKDSGKRNLRGPRRVVWTVRGPVHERPDVPVGFVWPFCPLPSQLISGFQTFLSCTPIWKTLECLFPYKLDYACWVKPLFNFLLFLGSNPGPYTWETNSLPDTCMPNLHYYFVCQNTSTQHENSLKTPKIQNSSEPKTIFGDIIDPWVEYHILLNFVPWKKLFFKKL